MAAATSSGCYRTAATASLSITFLVVKTLSEDDAQVEKQAVMEIEGLGMLMLVDMSVRWKPRPECAEERPHDLYVDHPY